VFTRAGEKRRNSKRHSRINFLHQRHAKSACFGSATRSCTLPHRAWATDAIQPSTTVQPHEKISLSCALSCATFKPPKPGITRGSGRTGLYGDDLAEFHLRSAPVRMRRSVIAESESRVEGISACALLSFSVTACTYTLVCLATYASIAGETSNAFAFIRHSTYNKGNAIYAERLCTARWGG
jgi:hypothetical protein